MANTTTFEEFKGGEWEGKSLDWAKESDWKNYEAVMADPSKSDALKEATAKAHGLEWTPPSSSKENGADPIVYEPPDRPSPHEPEDRPTYEGPPYYDPRTFDPTPSYLDLQELEPEDYVSNRIAMLLDKGSPLFRQVSEAAARKFGNRGPRAQEAMMGEIMKVARPIAEAEALMRERYKGKLNDAFFKQMDIRMSGAMQQAVAHISGEYGLTVATMQDITNQWKAQLAADMQAYNIETGAAVSTYATQVQEALGMRGLDVKMADIMSKIEDNAEAASFIWDMIYGDNDLSPAEFHEKWKEKWADLAGDTETETGTTGTVVDIQASIKGNISRANDAFNKGDAAAVARICSIAANQARSNAGISAEWYNANNGPCPNI